MELKEEDSLDTPSSDPPRTPESVQLDWPQLRTLSLATGGFRDKRVEIWPQLLHVHNSSSKVETANYKLEQQDIPASETTGDHIPPESEVVELSPAAHPDERQIRLDTERSFVLYPVDDCEMKDREAKQEELHSLLVSIFRARQKLSYFQGYHDIVTVIFLTLPRELQLPCAEKLSLQRVRDSMGSSLEPILGLLRVMKKLLRLVDPKYASTLERNSPLPYYALSNLLTLFSHDMPTLPLIQHVFDYLLCRPPIIIVYLATAIVLSRKDDVRRLEEEGEEGMVHSLLSGLPDIYDEEPALSDGEEETADGLMTDPKDSPTLNPIPGLEDDSHLVHQIGEFKDELLKKGMDDSIPSPGTSPFSSLPSLVDEKTKDSIDGPPLLTPLEALSEVTTEDPPDSLALGPEDNNEKRTSPLPEPAHHPRKVKVSLSSLLTQADELFSTYPPTHPSLALSSTMGPQSVVFTWCENPSELPDDDEAESMVERPELIVYPYIDSQPPSDNESDGKKSQRRKRRKVLKPTRFSGMLTEKKAMAVGAVLVLGVALAVYGIRAKGHGAFGHDGHVGRRIKGWVGGLLVGISDKIMDGIGLL